MHMYIHICMCPSPTGGESPFRVFGVVWFFKLVGFSEKAWSPPPHAAFSENSKNKKHTRRKTQKGGSPPLEGIVDLHIYRHISIYIYRNIYIYMY